MVHRLFDWLTGWVKLGDDAITFDEDELDIVQLSDGSAGVLHLPEEGGE